MTDDSDPGDLPTNPDGPRVLAVPDDPTHLLTDTNLRMLDAVYHTAGLIASEDYSLSGADALADERALQDFVRRLVAGG